MTVVVLISNRGTAEYLASRRHTLVNTLVSHSILLEERRHLVWLHIANCKSRLFRRPLLRGGAGWQLGGNTYAVYADDRAKQRANLLVSSIPSMTLYHKNLASVSRVGMILYCKRMLFLLSGIASSRAGYSS